MEAPASDEEGEEYGMEVLNTLNKDNKKILEEWNQNEGVKPMKGGGKTDYRQAVL